jgi:hypothetical protein
MNGLVRNPQQGTAREIVTLCACFCHSDYAKCGALGQVKGGQMIEVSNGPAKPVNFREEASECVQLAKAETCEAVRTFCWVWRLAL